MHKVQFEEPNQTQLTDSDSPPIISFKELLDARQKKLDEKSKSLGNINMKKPIEISPSKTKLPSLKTKQQSSILKKLTYDFGSLNEFLNYDLKLKKPEELFKGIFLFQRILTNFL